VAKGAAAVKADLHQKKPGFWPFTSWEEKQARAAF